MDNKNIYHIAEAVRTRAKGLACIHMAKLFASPQHCGLIYPDFWEHSCSPLNSAQEC